VPLRVAVRTRRVVRRREVTGRKASYHCCQFAGLATVGARCTESFRLQIGLILERMQVTAEVSSLAPAVALLPGLPVFDSRIFGAHRDSQLGSGQKESGR
jgi:hypothetical protein